MSTTVRVYVDGRGVDVPGEGTALDAVRLVNEDEAGAVAAGTRLITDSRGLPIEHGERAYAGAIYRVVTNRERARAGTGAP